MSIRIIVADDHKIVRDGITALLAREPDMEVIGTASDGRSAVAAVKELQPDVVIMDVGMHDLNGIEATRQICDQFPGVKVLSLSMHSDRLFVERMLRAGAAGYILKDCAFEELHLAIRQIMDGHVYLSVPLLGVVVDDYIRTKALTEQDRLTPREREVLQMIAEGRTTKQIALTFNLSTKTIETHRQRMMDKLDIHSIAELTKYAIRGGITTL